MFSHSCPVRSCICWLDRYHSSRTVVLSFSGVILSEKSVLASSRVTYILQYDCFSIAWFLTIIFWAGLLHSLMMLSINDLDMSGYQKGAWTWGYEEDATDLFDGENPPQCVISVEVDEILSFCIMTLPEILLMHFFHLFLDQTGRSFTGIDVAFNLHILAVSISR